MSVRIPLRRGAVLCAAGLILLLSVGVGMGLAVAAGVSGTGAIYPGVRILGVEVGGLTQEQAVRYIGSHAEQVVARPVWIHYGSGTWRVEPADAGLRPALRAMVAQAHRIGRRGHTLQQVAERVRARFQGVDVALSVTADEATLHGVLDEIAAQVTRPAEDAALVPDGGRVRVQPGREGLVVSLQEAAARVKAAAARWENRSVTLPVRARAPAVTAAELDALGIRVEKARFTTRFDPAEQDRSHNIRLAAEALAGAVVLPGESLSFNARVGSRTRENGYRQAPVILHGEKVPGVGGGVCQVSTTLYNAVLLAGMEVEERRPHSLAPSYVPLGRDATVVYGQIDLRFRNTSGQPVLVHAAVEGDRLTVSLYGGEAVPEPRLVTEIQEVLAPPVETADPPEDASEELRAAPGREGYRVALWRVQPAEDGQEAERELVARSTYPPRPRIVPGDGGETSAASP